VAVLPRTELQAITVVAVVPVSLGPDPNKYGLHNLHTNRGKKLVGFDSPRQRIKLDSNRCITGK